MKVDFKKLETAPVDYRNLSREEWDSLVDKKELYAAFNQYYENENLNLNYLSILAKDPAADFFYSDAELETMAKKFNDAAKPLRPVIKELLKRFPDPKRPGFNYSYEDQAEGRIESYIRPWTMDGLGIYTALLLLALSDDPNMGYAARLKEGFALPQLRAARRAYRRYLAFKEEDARKRAAFEQTPEYRLQKLEMLEGKRDHIEYPA